MALVSSDVQMRLGSRKDVDRIEAEPDLALPKNASCFWQSVLTWFYSNWSYRLMMYTSLGPWHLKTSTTGLVSFGACTIL
jgi:hypothetical protein